MKDLARSVDTLSLSELAKRYEVSERTIRNDIAELNTMLSKAGLSELTFGAGGEIIIPQDFSHAQRALHVSDTLSYRLSSEERTAFGAGILIAGNDYITTGDLAQAFSVSRTTVLNDLPNIKQAVANAGLVVESKPGKGMRAIGAESARRLYLVDLLLQEDPVSSLWLSSTEGVQLRKVAAIALNVIERVSQQLNLSLPDINFHAAVCVLVVMVERAKEKAYLEKLGEEFLGCSREFVGAFEQQAIAQMSEKCEVLFNSDDELFFAAVAQTFRYHNEEIIDVDKTTAVRLAQRLIQGTSRRLEVGLENDMELLGQLSNYLELMLTASEPLRADDPVAGEIARNQPRILAAVRSELGLIEKSFGRPLGNDEVAGLTLCFCAAIERWKVVRGRPRVAVVCSGGDTTAHLMAEQLRRRFGVRVACVLRVHEAKTLDPTRADLVVSTTPLANCKLPVAVAHPVLDERDYALIAQKLDETGVGWNVTISSEGQRVDQRLASRHDERAKALLDELTPVIQQRVGDDDPLLEEVRSIVMRHFAKA